MPTAIRVERLGKRYRIGERQEAYGTLRDTLASGVVRLARALRGAASDGSKPEIWALRDVSFELETGEVLGIIGPNGAGKSTLLKILARVTAPTSGRAWIHGRVGSLLDVGTGFHPELTGRENIYLNGAILGMRKADIDRRFDEIVAFAEQEQFLDTPVKRYSSGMFMRLAFSVAAHLDPDILIVDEVLAVGDAKFQRKCLGKMGNAATEGRTVLFVSHNMVAVQGLCHRAIWLDRGEIIAQGQPGSVVSRYLQASSSTVTEQAWDSPSVGPGNDAIRLRRARVRPTDGSSSDPITMRTPIVVEFEFWNLVEGSYVDLNIQLVTERGEIAFETGPGDDSEWHGRPYSAGLYHSECFIPGDLLIAGQHRVVLTFVKDNYHILYRHEDALVFDVQDVAEVRGEWYGEMVGAVRPLLKWTTELIDAQI